MPPINAYSDNLLVFRHVDFPTAGIQIPGGTMEAGETPEIAVMREAREETGLQGLVLEKSSGSDEYHASSSNLEEIHLRHFFHLLCLPDVPETWQHDEHHPSDGSPSPTLFEFSWLPLTKAAGILAPYYNTNLDRLLDSLAGNPLDGD